MGYHGRLFHKLLKPLRMSNHFHTFHQYDYYHYAPPPPPPAPPFYLLCSQLHIHILVTCESDSHSILFLDFGALSTDSSFLMSFPSVWFSLKFKNKHKNSPPLRISIQRQIFPLGKIVITSYWYFPQALPVISNIKRSTWVCNKEQFCCACLLACVLF